MEKASTTHRTTVRVDKFGRRTMQQARGDRGHNKPTINGSIGGAMTFAKAAAMVMAKARARV